MNRQSCEHPPRVSRKLRYGVNSLDAEDSADNRLGSSHGRCSCAASCPSTLGRNQNTICDTPFLVFVFTTLPASPFLAVNAHTGQFIVEQATVSEGAFYTCSNARFQICDQLCSGDRFTQRQRLTWHSRPRYRRCFEGVLAIKSPAN